jgi:hypothetical protein
MFRTLIVAAGLLLALGSIGTADAARTRGRAPATTEAAAGTAEAPRAATTRRTRRTEAQRQRRARGEATTTRRARGEAGSTRQRRTQTAQASGTRRGARSGAAPVADTQ